MLLLPPAAAYHQGASANGTGAGARPTPLPSPTSRPVNRSCEDRCRAVDGQKSTEEHAYTVTRRQSLQPQRHWVAGSTSHRRVVSGSWASTSTHLTPRPSIFHHPFHRPHLTHPSSSSSSSAHSPALPAPCSRRDPWAAGQLRPPPRHRPGPSGGPRRPGDPSALRALRRWPCKGVWGGRCWSGPSGPNAARKGPLLTR